MSNDKSKLPKWAQTEIYRLTRDLASANKKLFEMDASHESNVTWSSGLMDTHNLPVDARVTFLVDGKEVTVSISEDALYISGERELAIVPRASNSFFVKNAE